MTTPVTAEKPAKAAASAFQKNVAGVPIWGWLAIGVAVFGGMYYLRANSARKSATSSEVEQGGGYLPVGYMPLTTTSEIERINTNEDWRIKAEKVLVQKGFDPKEVADAVQTYVNGGKLTAKQNTMISVALREVGPLPEGRDGPVGKTSRLAQAADGNILGMLVEDLANAAGLDDPDNPFGRYLVPIVNNFIEHGPVSGGFQSVNEVVGADFSGQVGPEVDIPGVGKIGLNLAGSNTGISGGGSASGIPIQTPWGTVRVGGSGSGSLAPASTDTYIAKHMVRQGDTLTSISKKYYGGAGGELKIYRANLNKIPNPAKLAPGTELDIPGLGVRRY